MDVFLGFDYQDQVKHISLFRANLGLLYVKTESLHMGRGTMELYGDVCGTEEKLVHVLQYSWC